MKTAIQRIQETVTKPMAPIKYTPIATRTRGAQTAANQIQAAAKEVAGKKSQGPAGNTRSKLHNTLKKAMYVACFIDNKNRDAQRLASQRCPAAMFAVVLAVMDIELGAMTKH